MLYASHCTPIDGLCNHCGASLDMGGIARPDNWLGRMAWDLDRVVPGQVKALGTWSLCLDYSRYFFRLYSVPIALLGTFNSMDLDTRSQPSYHRSLFLNGTSGICYAYTRYPTQSAIPTSQSTPILSPTNALDSQTPSLNYLVLRALGSRPPVHVGGGGGVSDDSGDPHVRGAPRIGSAASDLDRAAPHLNLAQPTPIMDPPGLGPSCPPSHLSRLGQSERSARRLNDTTTSPRIVATEQIRGTSLARHFRRELVGSRPCYRKHSTLVPASRDHTNTALLSGFTRCDPLLLLARSSYSFPDFRLPDVEVEPPGSYLCLFWKGSLWATARTGCHGSFAMGPRSDSQSEMGFKVEEPVMQRSELMRPGRAEGLELGLSEWRLESEHRTSSV
ncbi:hypothetical protein AG1IA_02975 [Rhizoctonia solani AG-1 IA]|uniref:Uncharacterized protein n=1 Tax=Thanatephorus cucumeris (strain AG1-IA) TaxID=983506 RepID=L8X1L9_THACA|nr:hypothetical protein AG1IA_02975 [Rhizoctonia solani AG-1 IA]